MKEKFIEFLKEKGVYGEFESRLICGGWRKSIDDILEEHPQKFISSAFIWDMYHDVQKWVKLNNEWINLLKQTKQTKL